MPTKKEEDVTYGPCVGAAKHKRRWEATESFTPADSPEDANRALPSVGVEGHHSPGEAGTAS